MTLVTINIDHNAAGQGAKAHVVVDGIGSADCWGSSKGDALHRAARWAAEHLGESTAPDSAEWPEV